MRGGPVPPPCALHVFMWMHTHMSAMATASSLNRKPCCTLHVFLPELSLCASFFMTATGWVTAEGLPASNGS